MNIPEWTVSELAAALKRTVEDAFGFVRVRGEVSGYRGPHGSGHVYFALKDENARLDAVIWKSTFARLRFKPEEGLEVVATGRLTTYPGRSSYQIIIDSLEPAGVGALMALLEERKKKLAAEGLFAEERKKPLPFLPEVIGVVTSPTGAVIRDILHRLADRFPRRVIVWPVRVQGEGSAEEVAAAIRGFNALPEEGPIPRPDLLIVARGGGSIEDLWSFNEEVVVRAAAGSRIPLIAAVGHETDVTLIDFAADKRAPTPTAAAEMAVPVRTELMARVDQLARRAFAAWMRAQETRRTELRAAVRALPTVDQLLAIPRQRLDVAAHRLPRALRANAQLHHMAFSRVSGRLAPQLLRRQLALADERLFALTNRSKLAFRVLVERTDERYRAVASRLAIAFRSNADAYRARITRERDRSEALLVRLRRAIATLVARRNADVERLAKLLAALSYRSVLARGFALVRDEGGHPLHTAAAVAPAMRLDIEFADGHVGAIATHGGAPSALASTERSKSKPRRRGEGDPGQGRLFDSLGGSLSKQRT